jgi:hypothetical protein
MAGVAYKIGAANPDLTYSLPQIPLATSVMVRWELASDQQTFRMLTMDETQTVTINNLDVLGTTAAMGQISKVVNSTTEIVGVVSTGRLPPGTYNFSISYRNSSGGSAITATTNGVNLRVRCDAGFYSNDGYSPCDPATAGHFASTDGTENVECPVGEYQPSTGSSSCIPAEIGSFVPETGSRMPTLCPAGSTTTITGQNSCTLIATEDSSTTSTSSTSTTVPQSTSTSSTSTTPSTMTTTSTTTTAAPIVIVATPKACTVKKSRNISRSCLIQNAKITVVASSKVVIKVTTASKKVCTLKGTVLKALKKGTCSTTLTVTPKGKKSKTYKARVIVIS